MDCRYLENTYELFLLGALDEPGAARIQEHAASACPNCRQGLREAALTLFALMQQTEPVSTTAGQRSRFLKKLKEVQHDARRSR